MAPGRATHVGKAWVRYPGEWRASVHGAERGPPCTPAGTLHRFFAVAAGSPHPPLRVLLSQRVWRGRLHSPFISSGRLLARQPCGGVERRAHWQAASPSVIRPALGLEGRPSHPPHGRPPGWSGPAMRATGGSAWLRVLGDWARAHAAWPCSRSRSPPAVRFCGSAPVGSSLRHAPRRLPHIYAACSSMPVGAGCSAPPRRSEVV